MNLFGNFIVINSIRMSIKNTLVLLLLLIGHYFGFGQRIDDFETYTNDAELQERRNQLYA